MPTLNKRWAAPVEAAEMDGFFESCSACSPVLLLLLYLMLQVSGQNFDFLTHLNRVKYEINLVVL